MIHLHTLGDCLIKVDEKEIRPTSPLLFAALLYLGMERGRRVPRAALQEMFFPNADERSGAHSVRQLLYKLRQLGCPVIATGHSVSIEQTDVADDLQSLSLTATAFDTSARFLPGYAPLVSEAFTEWLDARRSSAFGVQRRHLVEMLAKARRAWDWATVDLLSRRILEIDPLHEEATLALAEATAIAGSKAEAVRLLDNYASETDTRLTLAPSVLRRRISEAFSSRGSSEVPPFVGRADLIALILGELQTSLTTGARTLLITGDAGVGKSRLVAETVARVMLEGRYAVVVTCREQQRRRPMGVLVDLVRALLQLPGSLGVTPHSHDQLKVLLSGGDDGLQVPIDARDVSTRSSLIQSAVRDLLDAVVAEQQCAIIIEDVHWADKESLGVLFDVRDAVQERGLFLLLTARGLPLEVMRSMSHRQVNRHELEPLTRDEMVVLATFLTRSRLGDDQVDWCIGAADGNPLYLQLLCEHCIASQEAFCVPDTLRALVAGRVEALSSPARRILELSAALGPHCSLEALAELSQTPKGELITHLCELEHGRLLKFSGDELRVGHELVGKCAVEALTPIARAMLHRLVAGHLQHQYERTADSGLMWDCAEHWFLSGDRANAMHFLRRCARHAVRIAQVSAALELLENAQSLARTRAEHVALCEDTMLVARAADRFPVIHEAAKKLALLRPEIERNHDVYEILALEAQWEASYKASEVGTQLKNCVDCDAATVEHRLDAAIHLLRVAHECNRPDVAHAVFAKVQPLLQESNGYAKHILPIIYETSFGDRARALSLARETRARRVDWPSISDQLRAGFNIAIALSFLGESEESAQFHGELYDKAGSLGLKEWQIDFGTSACWHYLEIQNVDAATMWYDRVESLIKISQAGKLLLRRHVAARSELALLRRNQDEARRALRELEEIGGGESERVAVHLNTFATRLRLRDPYYVCADEDVDTLQHWYRKCRLINEGGSVAGALADALCRVGRRHEAKAILVDYLELHRPFGVHPTHPINGMLAALDIDVVKLATHPGFGDV